MNHFFDHEFYREHINATLTRFLPTGALPLDKAMHYATLQGGKRFRPLLVYAAGLSFGAELAVLDYPAMAVEIIHAYSLVHDDLPAMDNDALRRGQPTCHIAFGEAIAILAGDAMQALAFEILTQCPHSQALTMIQQLAKACGATGMAGGQARDLAAAGSALTETQLQTIHQEKTGALIYASLLLGALAAPASAKIDWQQFKEFGYLLGLAYQVQDDIFDVELPTSIRGKQQGADALLNKPTYPSILGMDNAKHKLQHLMQDIEERLTLMQLNFSPLAQLVDSIFQRKL